MSNMPGPTPTPLQLLNEYLEATSAVRVANNRFTRALDRLSYFKVPHGCYVLGHTVCIVRQAYGGTDTVVDIHTAKEIL